MNQKYIDNVIETIEKELNIDNLKKKTRKLKYIDARRIAFKIFREKGLTFDKIGSIFDLNHASVIHSLKDFDFFVKHLKGYEESYNSIRYKSLDPELRKKVIISEIYELQKEYFIICKNNEEDINNLLEVNKLALQEYIAKNELFVDNI